MSGTRPSSLLDRVERIANFLPVDRVDGRGHCRSSNLTPLRFVAAGYADPIAVQRLGRARLVRFLG